MSDDSNTGMPLSYATADRYAVIGRTWSLTARATRRLCLITGVGVLAGVYNGELKLWLAKVGWMLVAVCVPLGRLPWERRCRDEV